MLKGSIKRNKYGNKKTKTLHGEYDSKWEAKVGFDLTMRQKAGEIKDLKKQVPFVLQDAFVHEGHKHRPITYIADFVYSEKQDGKWIQIVADAKGTKTQTYMMKKKMFLKRYGDKYKFLEVMK